MSEKVDRDKVNENRVQGFREQLNHQSRTKKKTWSTILNQENIEENLFEVL